MHLQKLHVWGSHCRADLVSLQGEVPDHLLQVLSSVYSFDQMPKEITGVINRKLYNWPLYPNEAAQNALSEVVVQGSLLLHSPQWREHLVATELDRDSHLQSRGLQAVLPTWVRKMEEMARVVLMSLLAANASFY